MRLSMEFGDRLLAVYLYAHDPFVWWTIAAQFTYEKL